MSNDFELKPNRVKKAKVFAIMWFFFAGLSFSQVKKLEVYIAISEECPVCIYMTKPLKDLEEKYRENVRFTVVFPNALSHYKSIHYFKQKYGLQHFESILDENQSFVKKYTLSVTPEVIVFDTLHNLIYKGRINDGYYAPGKMKRSTISNDLDIALETWLSEKKKLEKWPDAVGCYITLKK